MPPGAQLTPPVEAFLPSHHSFWLLFFPLWSCGVVCGILVPQGSNPHLLRWQRGVSRWPARQVPSPSFLGILEGECAGGRPRVCDEGRCHFLPFPAPHPPRFFPSADSSAEGSTQIPKGSFQGHREYVSPLVCVIRVGAAGRSSSLYRERAFAGRLRLSPKTGSRSTLWSLPPSPGQDLRAPSGLPISADSAWLTPPRPRPDPGGRPFPGYPASTLGYSVGSLPAARDSPGN